jgi:hypothetical protein
MAPLLSKARHAGESQNCDDSQLSLRSRGTNGTQYPFTQPVGAVQSVGVEQLRHTVPVFEGTH